MRMFLVYALDALKIHRIGKPWVAQAVFMVMLACSLLSLLIPISLEPVEVTPVLLNLLLLALSNLAGVVYLDVSLLRQILSNTGSGKPSVPAREQAQDQAKEPEQLKDQAPTREQEQEQARARSQAAEAPPFRGTPGLGHVLRRIYLIIPAMVLFYLATLLGVAFLFIIPGLFFFTASLFYMCRILDKGEGILASFKGSWKMTAGYRLRIFLYYAGFSLLLYSLTSVLLSLLEWIYRSATGTPPGGTFSNFIIFFMLSLANLMQQRMTGAIYADIEYHSKRAVAAGKRQNPQG